MNREILFRAKSIQTGRWISGYYFEDEDSKSYIGYMSKKRYIPDTRDWDIVEYYENNPTYNWVFVKEEVVSETVGQFTGQYDANKKKIYEGDIIQYDGDYDGIDGFTRSFSEKAIVLWDEDYCGFVCKVIGDESGDSYSWLEYRENPDLTIIGNIYDNPELLKA